MTTTKNTTPKARDRHTVLELHTTMPLLLNVDWDLAPNPDLVTMISSLYTVVDGHPQATTLKTKTTNE